MISTHCPMLKNIFYYHDMQYLKSIQGSKLDKMAQNWAVSPFIFHLSLGLVKILMAVIEITRLQNDKNLFPWSIKEADFSWRTWPCQFLLFHCLVTSCQVSEKRYCRKHHNFFSLITTTDWVYSSAELKFINMAVFLLDLLGQSRISKINT